ncbi:lipoprotein, partial [Metamycoplasma alkalescens]
MKKSNKILLVLGSISSLSALPLVAASCGNKTKQEQENKSNDTSNNESSNQQKGDKDKDNKNDGVKPKDGNSQTEQGSNTSNNKDTTSKKDDEKNKNEDSNSANAKESNSVLKELEEKLTSLKALNSKIEEIEKELDKELDDENLGSSDTSNEEKEKTLENVNRVNETLTAFIGALEEIKKDDSYIKGEFQEELLEIFSEINEYIELIW